MEPLGTSHKVLYVVNSFVYTVLFTFAGRATFTFFRLCVFFGFGNFLAFVMARKNEEIAVFLSRTLSVIIVIITFINV